MLLLLIHSLPHLEMDIFTSPYDEVLVSLIVISMATLFVFIGEQVNTNHSDIWKGMPTKKKKFMTNLILKCLIFLTKFVINTQWPVVGVVYQNLLTSYTYY